jgi:succinoglycan biosynthesis transport protein ExoP
MRSVGVELKDFLLVLYRWIWLLVLGMLAAMISGYLALHHFSPWPPYEATVTLSIGSEDMDVNSAQALRETYAELARRRPVSQTVVDALNLPMSADDLEDLVKVNLVGYTRLMEVSVKYSDPQQAATIANEIARQLSRLSFSSQARSVKTIAEARVPTRPSPGAYVSILVAGVAGLSLTIGAVMLMEYLGGKIRVAQDVERKLRLTVLGTVRHPGKNGRRSPFSNVTGRHQAGEARDPSTPASEIYRWMCFKIDHAEDRPPRRLLITSPDAAEGQTSLAVELASAWAENDQKVVLVNARLPQPVISRWFGLSNAVSSSAPEEQVDHEAIHQGEIISPGEENVTASCVPAQYSARQASQKPRAVLDDLSSQVDVIIVDGPPILSRPNAAAFAAYVDGVLLLLNAGKTRINVAQEALKVLQTVGGKVLGVILLT